MTPTAFRRVARIAMALLAAALPAWAPAADSTAALAPGDQAAVRQVLESYRSAWLANNADAVLDLFTADAVLMPHHGVEPVVGKQAARAFWFPAGSLPTTITAFTQTLDQVGGSGDVAYIRGHTRVEWVTGTGPNAKRSVNAGTSLAVLRRQNSGSWRIAVLMWDDPPNQTTAPPR